MCNLHYILQKYAQCALYSCGYIICSSGSNFSFTHIRQGCFTGTIVGLILGLRLANDGVTL